MFLFPERFALSVNFPDEWGRGYGTAQGTWQHWDLQGGTELLSAFQFNSSWCNQGWGQSPPNPALSFVAYLEDALWDKPSFREV